MEPSGKNTGLRLRSTEFLPQFYQGVALWLWHPVLPFGLNVHICNKDRIGPEDCYASSPRENGMRLSKARFSYLHQYTRSTEQKLISGFSLVAVSGGHSLLQCVGLSLRWPLLLRSMGSRRAGSVTGAHGPSCSMACGIIPDQGLNPHPLHWQADSQPLRHQGSPARIFKLLFIVQKLLQHC